MTNTSTNKTKATKSTPEITDPSNGLAIISLVLGILSLTGFFFLTGVPAIITGILALRKNQKERGMSIAGIIMGSIGTLISLLFFLALILLIAIGIMSDPPTMQDEPLFDTDMNMPIESSRT